MSQDAPSTGSAPAVQTEPEAPSASQGLYSAELSVVGRVPVSLRVAAAWSWRIVVVGIVLVAGYWGFTSLAALFVPLIIATLIAAPLERLVVQMTRIKIPRGLAALLAILLMVAVIVFLMIAASSSIITGFDDLRVAAIEGFETFTQWLVSGPLGLSQEQIDGLIENVQSTVGDNAWGLASGALTVGSTLGALFAGVVIALLALFFFLRDGRSIWMWCVGLLPGDQTDRVDHAGVHAWVTLRRYTQTSVFVAFVDAVGIGLAAWIIGVPLALPIAILVFLFSFIPLFGATISGAIAALVALVDGGPTTALFMLGAVLLVQQIEGNVLYPWLFGKAASIHPLAILLTVSAGTLMLGLVGAIIAVPIVAFCYAFARGLRQGYQPGDEEQPPITAQVPVLAHRSKQAIRRAREAITRTGEIRVRGAGEEHAAPPADGEPHSEQIPTRGSRD